MHRGTYVSPNAGKLRFDVYAERWAGSRNLTARSTERTTSILRNHLLPKWGEWPIGRIDHLSVQEWVTGLSKTLAPATVGKCFGTLRTILRSAMRARLIAVDPTEGVVAPSTYQARPLTATISREVFLGKLLPAAPLEHRAIVAIGGGAGLRWGEAAGLPWGAVDLTRRQLQVGQVAIETATEVTVRPYPKSRAGVRTIPIPAFLVRELEAHSELTVGDTSPDPGALVFPTRNGTPLRRSNFRRQVWRPALARAGLLGEVAAVGDAWRATWASQSGARQHRTLPTEREAIEYIARHAEGGLRYHDLRHSYATWLVSDGVPVNVVQRVMGHEQASTTLNRYTHTPNDFVQRVRAAFDGAAPFSLPPISQSANQPMQRKRRDRDNRCDLGLCT
jgi:integrase